MKVSWCSSLLGDTIDDPDRPRDPEKLCPRLVEEDGPELETVIDDCSRRGGIVALLEVWVLVECCFDM